ncbi:MAG: hypothetical protein ACO1OB_33290 [Archangium sp.]
MRLIVLTVAVFSSLCSAAEACDAAFAASAFQRFSAAVPTGQLPLVGLSAETVGSATLGPAVRMGVLEPASLSKIDAKSTVESVVPFGRRWIYPVVSEGRWVALVQLEQRGGECVAISFGSHRVAKGLDHARSVIGSADGLDVVFIPQALEYHVARREAPRELLLVASTNKAKEDPRFTSLVAVATRVKPIVASAIAGSR